MPGKLPPYVHRVRNKYGRDYYYFALRRGSRGEGKPHRMPDFPSAEFWSEYARLTGGTPLETLVRNTVSLVLDKWHASPEWKQLKPKTQTEWKRYSERIRSAWGDLEIAGIEPKNVLTLRDVFADQPASANNLLRCLSSFMGWSVPRGYRTTNPCREVKELKGGDSYDPWPWPLVEQAKTALLPTRPDLWHAIGLAVYTGQRLGDCLKMRWDHIEDGLISVRQEKTDKRLLIPIHADLRELLETIPRHAVTILTSSKGTPWGSGFQASWQACKPDCLKGYVFHGLRKTAVVTLLEAGCTDAEVASITGQSREMVELYGRKVNQKRLASAAILKWEKARAERPKND